MSTAPGPCMACVAYKHAECVQRKYQGAKITLCTCWCLNPAEVARKILELIANTTAAEERRLRKNYGDVIAFLQSEAKK